MTLLHQHHHRHHHQQQQHRHCRHQHSSHVAAAAATGTDSSGHAPAAPATRPSLIPNIHDDNELDEDGAAASDHDDGDGAAAGNVGDHDDEAGGGDSMRRTIELRIISAQDLKKVWQLGGRRMCTYAAAYIDPDHNDKDVGGRPAKARTSVDTRGGQNPVWNEVLRLSVPRDRLLPCSLACLTVDIFCIGPLAVLGRHDKLLGRARVFLSDFLRDCPSLHNPIQCKAFWLRPPLGDEPHGIVNLWIPPSGTFLRHADPFRNPPPLPSKPSTAFRNLLPREPSAAYRNLPSLPPDLSLVRPRRNRAPAHRASSIATQFHYKPDNAARVDHDQPLRRQLSHASCRTHVA